MKEVYLLEVVVVLVVTHDVENKDKSLKKVKKREIVNKLSAKARERKFRL